MWYFIYQTTNKIDGKMYIGMHKTSNYNDGYLGSGKLLTAAVLKRKATVTALKEARQLSSHPWKNKTINSCLTEEKCKEFLSKVSKNSAHFGEDNGFYKKTHTEESISKMVSNRRSYGNDGNPNAKSIVVNGIEYKTMKSASNATGLSLYKLRKIIKEVV